MLHLTKNLLSSCASALFLDSLFATLGHAQRYTAALHRQTVVLSSNQTALGQPARPRADPRRKSSIFAARYDIRIPFFRRKVNAAGPNLPLGIKNESFALIFAPKGGFVRLFAQNGNFTAGGWRLAAGCGMIGCSGSQSGSAISCRTKKDEAALFKLPPAARTSAAPQNARIRRDQHEIFH